MKNKFYTLVFLILAFSSTGLAQITIADTDMPAVNDTFRLSNAIDQWGIDASATGTGYTWDFSFLTPQSQNFDTCAAVSSTPIAYQFYFNNAFVYPAWKANYALRGQDINFGTFFSMTDVYEYYKVGATRFQDVGFGANISGVPASVRKNPIETVYSLPLNYGDLFSNYSKYDVNVPTFGEYKQKKWKDAEVDGWGTINLPIGSFPVLRVKFNVRIVDSVYIESFGFAYENPRPTEIHYHWLAAGRGMPLLQIVTDSATGTVTQITYQDKYVPFAGVKETGNKFTFDVYPNPVSQQVTISSAEPVQTVNLYDLFGRKVFSAMPMSNRYVLMVPSELANGAYVLECIGNKGRERQKLIVQR